MNVFNIFLVTFFAISASASNLTRIGDSNYYVSASEESFLEAEFLCRQDNMELISFETEEEFAKFNSTMDEWKINDSIAYWIGGLRLKSGLWYWEGTKSRISYTNWGTNEPNYPTQNQVYCIVMGDFDRPYKEGRKWCVQLCSNSYVYFCETRY